MVVASSHRFVGRAEELARLVAALERTEQGRPVGVLLAGDAGIGKTRLLIELADQARQRGMQVLLGGCQEIGDVGLPYLPFLDALHGLAADPKAAELLAEAARSVTGLGRLFPELAHAGRVGSQADDVFDQLQLFDAVRSLLVRLGTRAPVLLLLEDLHWADRSSVDLLAFLARTLRVGRVLVVGSYRSDELHRRHPLRPLLAEFLRLPGVERVQLGPLSRPELATHLETISRMPLSPDRLERIHLRSEGNPFYAEQLLAAGAGDTEVALPATLADVLLARVQALSEPAQQVLRAVSVAGRRVSHRLLVDAVGRPEADLEQALREAVDAGVLIADVATETYTFPHALLQEAVYGDLLPGEKVRLHATYTHLLTSHSEGRAAELAHHCLASNDLVGALAASVRAADEAAQVLAADETLRHLSSALELWERAPNPADVAGADRAELLLRTAKAASATGDDHHAARLAQDAATTAEAISDRTCAARAYERLGLYFLAAGHVEEALAARARAVELVPAQPPTPLRARVTAALAQVLINAGQREEADRWCNESLTVAQAIGDAEGEADILVTLGLIAEYDDPVKALSLYAKARTEAAEAGALETESRALQNLAWLQYHLGWLAAADASFDQGAELAQRTGLRWSRFGIGMRRGQFMVGYLTGAWDECERLVDAAGSVMALEAAKLASEGLAVTIARGRPDAHRRLGRLVARASVDYDLDVDVAVREAELATWQGDLEPARSAIQRALSAVEAIERVDDQVENMAWVGMKGLTVEAERAQRARAAGDTAALTDAIEVGRTLLERIRSAVRVAPRVGVRHDVHLRGWHVKAKAEWTRLQGRSDPKAWQAAVEAFSYGHVYAVARCRWRLAEALLGVGGREQAIVAARAAYQTAVELGAEPLQGALEALARRSRLDLGQGPPHESGRAGLTPRELEVLHLLIAGRSNRQIAEQLFISGKTASVHVTNILTKLGVHSRLEAAARGRKLGLDHPPGNGSR
jgi:DNA-binding CsgD family transcriptional regulator/tetratricopeptide (TPR) repeat protein